MVMEASTSNRLVVYYPPLVGGYQGFFIGLSVDDLF